LVDLLGRDRISDWVPKGNSVSRLRRLVASILIFIPIACVGERSVVIQRPAPTPPTVDGFDFPLDPLRYGPYVQGLTGPLDVDTRFGVQNPALGDTGKCFTDRDGNGVPFRELFHAGEDWFRLDAAGQVALGSASDDPVRAVARGTVYMTQQIGNQGWIAVLAHRLEDGSSVYSAYWHVAQPEVQRGDVVERGQVIGRIQDQGQNSHLHWEIRSFADGTQLFPADSAGGRGRCNGHVAGVAYTWDDDPDRARPEHWGYFDPVAFINTGHP
jgi:murein DD-endopeptidase MepM/ murein hydrolase activator NlpD